jgi:DNA (cytosine-5)-methyltransferase 1
LRYLSVCSGIEAATVAWHPLGWKAAAFAEIDKFPSAVLAHHYPDVPNLGDFTGIEGADVGPIDLLVGGTPCQSFSVAGLRGGLADDRGNLALEFLRLAQRARPRWLVWENVPGVLSSDGGRDFGSILGGMGELGYGWAYRVLDAQHFGVPQRRRRVFVVGYLGDWRRAAAVLFERHSLQGHSPPRRQAREGAAAAVAGSPSGGGGLGAHSDRDGSLISESLLGLPNSSHDVTKETYVPVAPTLRAGGNRTGGDRPPGTDVDTADSLLVVGSLGTRSAHHTSGLKHESDFLVARCDTARQQRMDWEAFHQNQRGEVTTNVTVGALKVGGGKPGQGYPAVAFNWQDNLNFQASDNSTNPLRRHQTEAVQSGAGVRRLMPEECEALQGFHRGYTLVAYRGKPAADGPRYKALGNSMAVPVMRWLGERINAVQRMN